MDQALIYSLAAVAIFCLGLYALIVQAHLLRRILAINVMATGVFLFFGAVARRSGGADCEPDPVPHAMVITGIVVAVAATAFAIALTRRIHQRTGEARLPEERERR